MDRLSLKYQGFFNDSITGHLTELLESALQENELDYNARLRLKALMVEQVQNVQRYSTEPRSGTLEVGTAEGTLFVKTSNPVSPESQLRIDARLQDLSRADKQSLRQRFREAMRQPLSDDDSGAGLGFLFLAQKSSRTLDFHFTPGEGHDPYFQLTSYL